VGARIQSVKPTLKQYALDGDYGLTHVGVPVSTAGGVTIEHRAVDALAPYDGHAGFTAVSRFEFLAHLAARSGSRLWRLGDLAIAVGGFAGPEGWAFEVGSPPPKADGNVRPATLVERDAAASGNAEPIEHGQFAERVCYGRLND
jgi:hypothetical protein